MLMKRYCDTGEEVELKERDDGHGHVIPDLNQMHSHA